MCDGAKLQELERKIDEQSEVLKEILELLKEQRNPIASLGQLLVEGHEVTKLKSLNKATISQNNKLEKFNEIGKRKLLMRLEDVAVIKNRKRKRTRSK